MQQSIARSLIAFECLLQHFCGVLVSLWEHVGVLLHDFWLLFGLRDGSHDLGALLSCLVNVLLFMLLLSVTQGLSFLFSFLVVLVFIFFFSDNFRLLLFLRHDFFFLLLIFLVKHHLLIKL
jgi:hypothetical protein